MPGLIFDGLFGSSGGGSGSTVAAILPLQVTSVSGVSTISIKSASDITSGSLSRNDFVKILYSTTLNEVYDADLDVNDKFYLPFYFQETEVYAVTKPATIVLPNFLTDPNKSSYNYDGDMIWVGSNYTSAHDISVVCEATLSGSPVPIIDPKSGVILTSIVANNVSIGYRWCDNNPNPSSRTNPVFWKVIDNGR
jgi:hypothetical protein